MATTHRRSPRQRRAMFAQMRKKTSRQPLQKLKRPRYEQPPPPALLGATMAAQAGLVQSELARSGYSVEGSIQKRLYANMQSGLTAPREITAGRLIREARKDPRIRKHAVFVPLMGKEARYASLNYPKTTWKPEHKRKAKQLFKEVHSKTKKWKSLAVFHPQKTPKRTLLFDLSLNSGPELKYPTKLSAPVLAHEFGHLRKGAIKGGGLFNRFRVVAEEFGAHRAGLKLYKAAGGTTRGYLRIAAPAFGTYINSRLMPGRTGITLGAGLLGFTLAKRIQKSAQERHRRRVARWKRAQR